MNLEQRSRGGLARAAEHKSFHARSAPFPALLTLTLRMTKKVWSELDDLMTRGTSEVAVPLLAIDGWLRRCLQFIDHSFASGSHELLYTVGLADTLVISTTVKQKYQVHTKSGQ